MKTKKIKGLTFKKATVVNLEASQLAAAKGGAFTDDGSTCAISCLVCPTEKEPFCEDTALCPHTATLVCC